VDAAAEPIVTRIRGLLPSLSDAERRIGERVLSDPSATARSTIGELARSSRTSLTTVTRFCRSLGLGGYAELRLGLATEAGRAQSQAWTESMGRGIAPDDPLPRVLQSLVAADTRTIQETAAQLDLAAVERAISALAEARRIAIYAVSGSGTMAHELQLRLYRIGLDATVWIDVHDGLTSAALLGPDDVALGISNSGETVEVLECLAEAGRQRALVIALTNFPRSSITKLADVVLTTAAEDSTRYSGRQSIRVAQMLVLNCLYVGVAQRTHARAEAALAVTAEAVRRHNLPERGRSGR
jgi:DNA-binding MurR/RpiR family transcriptional regulator